MSAAAAGGGDGDGRGGDDGGDGGARDPGLQPERTRLAWRRTTLTATAVAVLALKQGLRAGGAPMATAGTALIALLWLGFLWVAHRRIKELAADRPPGLAPRSALAGTLCTVALAGFAAALIL